jgi:hypothetical protein
MLRIPHCLDSHLTDGGKVTLVALPPPQKDGLILISLRGVYPRSTVRLEEIGKLKKKNENSTNSSALKPAIFWLVA